jgi:hypothetical protein
VLTPLVRATVLGLALLLGAGCDRMREVKRCRTLARQVNTSLDNIEAASKPGPTRAGYQAIASEYDAIAHGLDGFDAGAPELQRVVGEYAALARNSARQSTAFADALAAGNGASAMLASRELERLARHEKLLVTRIDEECRPK